MWGGSSLAHPATTLRSLSQQQHVSMGAQRSILVMLPARSGEPHAIRLRHAISRAGALHHRIIPQVPAAHSLRNASAAIPILSSRHVLCRNSQWPRRRRQTRGVLCHSLRRHPVDAVFCAHLIPSVGSYSVSLPNSCSRRRNAREPGPFAGRGDARLEHATPAICLVEGQSTCIGRR